MAPCHYSRDQDRYTTVRRNLLKLGYDSPITVDSLDLVEKLLSDYLTTTESLRRYKELFRTSNEKCSKYENAVGPYKEENKKLVNDCNHLNKKVLELTDELEQQKRAHDRKMEQMQLEMQRHRITESKFNKYISDLQDENTKKTIKLHQPQQPRIKPPFLPGGSSRCGIPPLRSAMSKENVRSNKYSASSRSDLDKIYFEQPTSSIMKVIEDQTASMSLDLQQAQKKIKDLHSENSHLQAKVSRRNSEIERLQSLLGEGMPMKRLAQSSGFVEDEIAKLKSQLKESDKIKHEAMQKAVQIMNKLEKSKKEMADMDKLACEVKERRDELEERLAECEDKFVKCCNENHELKDQLLQQPRGHSCNCREKVATEKKRLQTKLDQMARELIEKNDNERKLMNELKRLNEMLTKSKMTRSASVCSHKSSSTQSRETVPKSLLADQSAKVMELETQVMRLKAERDQYLLRCKKLTEEFAAVSNEGAINLVQQISLKDNELAAIQQENSNLMREISSLKTRLGNSQEPSSSTDIRDLLTQVEKDKNSVKAELHAVTAERDALREQLKYTAGKLAERQATNVHLMSSDNDRMNRLETERRELLQQKGSNQTHISTLEQQLRAVEADLTKQRTAYLQLKNLHEQTETALAIGQGELNQLRRDAALSQTRMSELKTLQAEVASLREEKARIRAEVDHKADDSNGLRLELDEKSEQIAMLQKEIYSKESWIAKQEKNIAELKEVLQCKCPLRNLHVSTKLKTVVKRGKKSSLASSKLPCPPKRWLRNAAVTRSPPANRVTQDSDLANKQDSRGMQREVQRLRKDLEAATHTQRASENENKRLQDDLTSALKDCKISQKKLALAQKEVEDLKQRLQNYVSEVQRIEEVLAQKESERNGLLDQYHCLSQEAIELETHNSSLKSQSHQVKQSLEVTESHVSNLEDQLCASKELIFTYESQLVKLTSCVKNLESELRQVKEQSESFEKDLNAVHELCMKLDNQKECLETDLKSSNKRSLELEANCAQLKSELGALHQQLKLEIGTKGAVESVLAESREETFKQRQTSEELAQELDYLRNEITKIKQTQNKEELQMVTRMAAEKSEEAEVLRRELTKEKYERVRMEEAHSSRMTKQKSADSASSLHSLKSLSPETSD